MQIDVAKENAEKLSESGPFWGCCAFCIGSQLLPNLAAWHPDEAPADNGDGDDDGNDDGDSSSP